MGLGQYAYRYFPALDGATSIKVAWTQNAGSTQTLVRRVNNADNTLLNTVLLSARGFDVVATPDCLTLITFEDLIPGTNTGVLKRRSAVDGSVLWSLNESALSGEPNTVGFRISPDGQYFGYVAALGNGVIGPRFRKVSDGSELFTLGTEGFDFAPNTSEVATLVGNGTVNNKVYIYDLPSGNFNRLWSITPSTANQLLYTPGGQHLSVSDTVSTQKYQADTGAFTEGFSRSDAVGYDLPLWIGSTLFRYGHSATVKAIDYWVSGTTPPTGRITLPTSVDVLSIAASYGKLVVAGAPSNGIGKALLNTYDATTGAFLSEDDAPSAGINAVGLPPDGSAILSVSGDRLVRCYDRLTKSLRWTQTYSFDVIRATISPDGTKVAVCFGNSAAPVVLSMTDGSLIQTLAVPDGESVLQLAFSPDGVNLVTTGTSTRQWRLSDGALLNTRGESGAAVAYSPNGSYVAVASGFAVHLLNAADLSLLADGYGSNGVPNNNPSGVAFSPDSLRLAFSQKATLTCLQVPDMSQRWLINPDAQNIQIGPVAFAPDGHVVSSYREGYGTAPTLLQFRDALTGTVVKAYDQETGLSSITTAFSSDGRYMAYGLSDSTLVVAKTPDLTPPVTMAFLAGSILTLNATDPPNLIPSGVASTYYTLDGGAQQTYTTPFNVVTPGPHTLVYWSTDNAGNVEAHHTTYFTVRTLTHLGISYSSVTGGTNLTGTLVLSSYANIDTMVTLSSTNPAVLPPTRVTIPAGSYTVTFPVTTLPVIATTTGDLSATLGAVTKTLPLTVKPPVLSRLSLSYSTVTGGTGITGTVALSANTAIATPVTLGNTNPAVSLPSSIVVPPGANSVTFPITTLPVISTTTGVISATFDGVTKTASVTVNPPVLSRLNVSYSSVTGGTGITGTIVLSANVATDTTVTLTNTNPAISMPTSVMVSAGMSSATFPMTTTPVATDTTGTVTATLGAVSKSATVTVKPPTLSTLTLTPNPVSGGNSVMGVVTLSGVAAVDTVVALTNTNANATLSDSTVTVPAGQSSVSFTMMTTPPTTIIRGLVQATLGTASRVVALFVKP